MARLKWVKAENKCYGKGYSVVVYRADDAPEVAIERRKITSGMISAESFVVVHNGEVIGQPTFKAAKEYAERLIAGGVK